MRYLVLQKCYINDKIHKPGDVVSRGGPVLPEESAVLRPLDPLPVAASAAVPSAAPAPATTLDPLGVLPGTGLADLLK